MQHRDLRRTKTQNNARFEILLEEKGPDWFRLTKSNKAGIKFTRRARSNSAKHGDLFGCNQQFDGKHHF